MIVRAQVVGVVAIEQVLPKDARSDNRWRRCRHGSCRPCRRFRLRALCEADGREEHDTQRREHLDFSHLGAFRTQPAAI
jgi:hypothetical protein